MMASRSAVACAAFGALLLAACGGSSAEPIAVATAEHEHGVVATVEPERAVESRPGEAREPETTQPLRFRSLVVPVEGRRAIRDRDVQVWVPEGSAPPSGWPFLVVTDGDLADTPTFHVIYTLRTLVDEGDVAPTVVIAVPSRVERNRELSARAPEFADFLADAVWPAVDARAPLAEKGAVLGYSFGGLAAVHAGVERSDRFDTVVAMSPSLWYRRRAVLRRVRRAREVSTRWWLDIGSLEGRPGEDVPYMVADARRLRDLLTARGLVLDVDLGYYEAPGRRHSMDEAGLRMQRALRFALGRRATR